MIVTSKEMRPRDPDDHYPTPLPFASATLAVLPSLPVRAIVLDPGAGTGVYGQAVKATYPNAYLIGVETRNVCIPAQYDAWWRGDVLTLPARVAFDAIVGNPPYKFAEQIVRWCMASLVEGGHLAFLLRLAFLEGQDRGDGLWQEFPPKAVYVCSKRPSFTGDNKTDATAYAVYHWVKGYTGQTRLDWLRVGKPQQMTFLQAA